MSRLDKIEQWMKSVDYATEEEGVRYCEGQPGDIAWLCRRLRLAEAVAEMSEQRRRTRDKAYHASTIGDAAELMYLLNRAKYEEQVEKKALELWSDNK